MPWYYYYYYSTALLIILFQQECGVNTMSTEMEIASLFLFAVLEVVGGWCCGCWNDMAYSVSK